MLLSSKNTNLCSSLANIYLAHFVRFILTSNTVMLGGMQDLLFVTKTKYYNSRLNRFFIYIQLQLFLNLTYRDIVLRFYQFLDIFFITFMQFWFSP